MKNLLVTLFTLIGLDLVAQVKFPDLSPQGRVQQKVGFTSISVVYERPSARGRKVFGELVPYKQLWRTGAGNCTKIKFDKNVIIGGKQVHAGAYSLFTIPGDQEWTIILNGDTTLYGTGGYDEKKDVVRFKAKTETTDRYYESLTIDIDVVPDDAELNISWEKTRVKFSIKTETDKAVTKMVNEELLAGEIKDPQLLAMGAEYYYFLGRDLDTALALVNKAIEIKATSWYYTLKVDILTKANRYSEAIETLKLNIAYVKTNPENWSKEQVGNVLEEQQVKMKTLESNLKK